MSLLMSIISPVWCISIKSSHLVIRLDSAQTTSPLCMFSNQTSRYNECKCARTCRNSAMAHFFFERYIFLILLRCKRTISSITFKWPLFTTLSFCRKVWVLVTGFLYFELTWNDWTVHIYSSGTFHTTAFKAILYPNVNSINCSSLFVISKY